MRLQGTLRPCLVQHEVSAKCMQDGMLAVVPLEATVAWMSQQVRQ